jgi:hypothetical protein
MQTHFWVWPLDNMFVLGIMSAHRDKLRSVPFKDYTLRNRYQSACFNMLDLIYSRDPEYFDWFVLK